MLSSTLLNVLDCTLPGCLTMDSWLLLIAHSLPLDYTLPLVFDGTLPGCMNYPPKSASKTLPSRLRVDSKVHLQVCSEVHFQAWLQECSKLHSIAHYHPTWLYASKKAVQMFPIYTPRLVQSSPPSPFWCTLLGMLSRTVPIALDGTLPTCMTVHSPSNLS
jgi:hypothetical protein